MNEATMSTDPSFAAFGARMRARVAACALADAGDTLIEVMIAALLVALIGAATFTGYTSVAQESRDQNERSQADSLAEQDQSRLKDLTLSALAGTGSGTGNWSYTQQVDGTTFTIASSTKFLSGSGSQSCTQSGATTADMVQTTSTVSWSPNNDGRGPVVVNGLIAPPEGGSLLTRASNSSGVLAGVTMTLTGGPTSAAPVLTDANGCAIFGGLAGGTYTVTATDTGYVTATTTVTVVPTITASTSFTLAAG